MAEKVVAYKWAFLLYPDDSAPENWKEILRNTLVPMAISPLHQPDGEGKDGERLKKHVHVICSFDTQKSLKQVKEIVEQVNGANPERIISPIGYYEYLIHKNYPDKEQFEGGLEAIEHMNGFDKENFIRAVDLGENQFTQIMRVIVENDFTEFASLVRYCYENCPENLTAIKKDSYFYNSYIRSMNHIKQKELQEFLRSGRTERDEQ